MGMLHNINESGQNTEKSIEDLSTCYSDPRERQPANASVKNSQSNVIIRLSSFKKKILLRRHALTKELILFVERVLKILNCHYLQLVNHSLLPAVS